MRLAIRRWQSPSLLFRLARSSDLRLSHIRQLSTASSRDDNIGTGSFRDPNSEYSDIATGNAAPSSHAKPGKRKKSPLSGRQRPPNRTITTLDSKRLDSGCFLDVSGPTIPNLNILFPGQDHPGLFRLFYRGRDFQRDKKRSHNHPFPVGTHGFLYFHANPQSPLHSQLRFRVTEDSDPAGFSRGHDLVYDKGYVWYLPVASVAGTHGSLLRLLAQDGLIDAKTISALQKQSVSHPNRVRRPVNSLCGSFALDMSVARPQLVIQAAGQDYPFPFVPPYAAHTRSLVLTRFYDEGLLLCRFERSTLPEHTGRRTLVLRLLKILVPPKVIPGRPSSAHTIPPAEGELFKRRGRVWSRDIDQETKINRLLCVLYDADNGQEPGWQS